MSPHASIVKLCYTKCEFMRLSASVLVTCGVFAFSGCGANKNHDQRASEAEFQNADAGVNCPGQCRPDPGSAPVDCASREAGFEFLPIWDFEAIDATSMFTFDDSTMSFNEGACPSFQPQTVAVDRCDIPQRAYHTYGGPFKNYGGGMGRSDLTTLVTQCGDRCPLSQGRPPPFSSLDVSQWDGISFWARRGPDSQPTIRVGVGDKYTHESANVDTHEFCSLARACDCPNGKPCSWYERTADDPMVLFSGTYCYDPVVDPKPIDINLCTQDLEVRYLACGETRCNQGSLEHIDPGILPDSKINNKACAPYAFDDGSSGMFCFNPGEETPAPLRERCGDVWLSYVNLSLDWDLYYVPFSELRQGGYGKTAPALDLTAIYGVTLGYGAGWTDYWIDDVRFYRAMR